MTKLSAALCRGLFDMPLSQAQEQIFRYEGICPFFLKLVESASCLYTIRPLIITPITAGMAEQS
ncbi:MAG: hypothetical protein AB2L14_25805 [Candidatus Xenobiia bacterium LiM19]